MNLRYSSKFAKAVSTLLKEVEDSTAKNSTASDERGATLVEYVLLASLIAVIALVGVRYFGTSVSAQFSLIGSAMP